MKAEIHQHRIDLFNSPQFEGTWEPLLDELKASTLSTTTSKRLQTLMHPNGRIDSFIYRTSESPSDAETIEILKCYGIEAYRKPLVIYLHREMKVRMEWWPHGSANISESWSDVAFTENKNGASNLRDEEVEELFKEAKKDTRFEWHMEEPNAHHPCGWVIWGVEIYNPEDAMHAMIHQTIIDITYSFADTINWELLYDELRAEHIAGLMQDGARSTASVVGGHLHVQIFRSSGLSDQEIAATLLRHGISSEVVATS